ncbi:MAG: GNAT family N-acetyltransferase [Armatimonadota bacterium]|nr:GNAT family N-acetyltransferase [Armatimonadota bacterium]
MGYELRMATPEDAQGIFETQVAAFSMEQDSIRWQRARSAAFDRAEEYIVMVDDEGRVIGLVHIGDTWIQVGECAVLKGDVGHVSIRPELQGRGLGTRMMRWTVEHLRDEGYHLSRLGGLMHFYSRFGYEPFLRRFVEIDLQSVRGGQRQIPPDEVYPEPEGLPGTVRPYDEARDFEDRVRLRWEFDHGRSGAPRVSRETEPPTHPAPPDPEAMRWVYERDGQVVGYLFASEAPLEARSDETVYALGDFAYAPQFPDAAGALVRTLLVRAAKTPPSRVTSRLPFDEMLTEALQLAGVSLQRKELHQAVAGNMILVLDLAATLRQVTPELSRRLARSPVADWQGAIEISFPRRGACPSEDPTQVTAGDALPGEACRLVIDGGEVSVAEGPGPVDLQLEMSQAHFVKGLFGICALTELSCCRLMDLTPSERGLLDALFPRTQTGSGPWG